MTMFQRFPARTLIRELVLIAAAVLYALPIYLVVSIALRHQSGLAKSPIGLPTKPQFGNFSKAWTESARVGGTSLSQGLINSFLVAVATLSLLIVIGAMVAYVLARTPGRLSSMLYATFLLGIILPAQLMIVPVFWLLKQLGLAGTYAGIVAFYVGFLLPLPVLLFTSFLRRMPVHLEEAALIDGASRLRIFSSIVLPLLRPVTMTVVVIGAIAVWNDLFTPILLLGGSNNATLPVAIYMFVGQDTTDWPVVFSAILIGVLPILLLYIAGQRFVVEGLTRGSALV